MLYLQAMHEKQRYCKVDFFNLSDPYFATLIMF